MIDKFMLNIFYYPLYQCPTNSSPLGSPPIKNLSPLIHPEFLGIPATRHPPPADIEKFSVTQFPLPAGFSQTSPVPGDPSWCKSPVPGQF